MTGNRTVLFFFKKKALGRRAAGAGRPLPHRADWKAEGRAGCAHGSASHRCHRRESGSSSSPPHPRARRLARVRARALARRRRRLARVALRKARPRGLRSLAARLSKSSKHMVLVISSRTLSHQLLSFTRANDCPRWDGQLSEISEAVLVQI